MKSIIDVGCGAGWFTNSCAHYYQSLVVGLDLNPIVLGQARAVARLMTGCEQNEFVAANVFDFDPEKRFDVVNSLGVLHHTADCHGAIRRIINWIEDGGYLHLGLYHEYGRRPFLQYFQNLRNEGASESELYTEFGRLNPNISDETHLLSWFRDQVLHPHETQHTFEEIYRLLVSIGLVVERTSINKFQKWSSVDELFDLERQMERASKKALYSENRYYPGFFVVWARKA